ncbi:MAG: cell division protein ZapA [Paludibacteraceae bacterium]|nr:cell division protein ZapA [Paludibacteraceae bacterium]
MPEETRHIILRLDAHSISMHVPASKEPIYRRAAAALQEVYSTYRNKYARLTAEQLWLHVALHMAVNLEDDFRKKSLEPVETKLDELVSIIQNKLENTEQ